MVKARSRAGRAGNVPPRAAGTPLDLGCLGHDDGDRDRVEVEGGEEGLK